MTENEGENPFVVNLQSLSTQSLCEMERYLDIPCDNAEHIENNVFVRMQAIMKKMTQTPLSVIKTMLLKMNKVKKIIAVSFAAVIILYFGGHYAAINIYRGEQKQLADQELEIYDTQNRVLLHNMVYAHSQANLQKLEQPFGPDSNTFMANCNLHYKIEKWGMTQSNTVSVRIPGDAPRLVHFYFSTNAKSPTEVTRDGKVIKLTNMKRKGHHKEESLELDVKLYVKRDDIGNLFNKLKHNAAKAHTIEHDLDEEKDYDELEFHAERSEHKDPDKWTSDHDFKIEPWGIMEIRHVKGNQFFEFSTDEDDKTKVEQLHHHHYHGKIIKLTNMIKKGKEQKRERYDLKLNIHHMKKARFEQLIKTLRAKANNALTFHDDEEEARAAKAKEKAESEHAKNHVKAEKENAKQRQEERKAEERRERQAADARAARNARPIPVLHSYHPVSDNSNTHKKRRTPRPAPPVTQRRRRNGCADDNFGRRLMAFLVFLLMFVQMLNSL